MTSLLLGKVLTLKACRSNNPSHPRKDGGITEDDQHQSGKDGTVHRVKGEILKGSKQICGQSI